MVLAVVVSTLQSTVPVPVQALVSRSQSLLATRVHSAFADTAVFTAATVVLAVTALWIVAAVLCKRKRPPPPAAYAHNRYERDSDAGAAPEYDVCIVGAGVVGASLATVLARQGVRVACVERDLTEPDRIVGELLQPSGVEKLKALGLYDAVCGIDAQSVPGYGIIMQRCGAAKQEHIKLPYPNRPNGGADNRDSRTGGAYADEQLSAMFTGRGLHNGRFLMALRRLARAEKNVTLIQGNVNKLLQRADGVVTGVVYRPTVAGAANSNPYPHLKPKAAPNANANGNANGNGHSADHKEAAASAADGGAATEGGAASQRVRAALTVVVDGCFSVFRQPIWDKKSTTRSKFLGLVLDNCELTVPGCGNVILADPSPVLVYPISSTETRMLIDFPTDQLPEDDDALVRHLTTKVRPQLPESVQRSFDPAVAGRRWQWMPNQSLCVERPNVPVGAMVLGDSFNMRHPLTGGGMTVGLTDVELVARLFKPISAAQPADGATRWRDTQYVHSRVTAFYEQRLGRNAVINILADALYQVFLFKNTDLCEACYDYLGKGPRCYEGPVALLSGLSRSQALLVAHFYSVALFAVGRLCLRLRFVAAVNMFRTACRIILPLLVQENNTAPVRAVWHIARWAFWL